MTITTVILTAIVISLHIYFLILEMFLWDKPFGIRTFGHDKKTAKVSKALAMNQGLYNGFLAAGLIWGLSLNSGGSSILTFFLSCIIVAGIFGGITANRKILLFQAFPAFLALISLLIA